jgi:predicted nucleotide-binding protein
MLDIKTLTFLLNKIIRSSHEQFKVTVGQFFSFLDAGAKENLAYISYQEDLAKWRMYTDLEYRFDMRREFPKDLDEIKSFSYAVYKSISTAIDNDIYMRYCFGGGQYAKALEEFQEVFYDYFAMAIEDIINAAKTESKNINSGWQRNQTSVGDHNHKEKMVFIIHGHDNYLKLQTQLLLERAKVEYIVLHEVLDKGRTIIDKLIDEGGRASYAIALLSPDDMVENGLKRARQNVVFEIGYFMGKLGKSNVRLLKMDGVEIPSDLQGILYEEYDEKGAWKTHLLNELEEAGITVDAKAALKK